MRARQVLVSGQVPEDVELSPFPLTALFPPPTPTILLLLFLFLSPPFYLISLLLGIHCLPHSPGERAIKIFLRTESTRGQETAGFREELPDVCFYSNVKCGKDELGGIPSMLRSFGFYLIIVCQ